MLFKKMYKYITMYNQKQKIVLSDIASEYAYFHIVGEKQYVGQVVCPNS